MNFHAEEIEGNNFFVDLITVEVSLIGFVNYEGFQRLTNAVCASNKELKTLLLSISSATIKGSFLIWTGHNYTNSC